MIWAGGVLLVLLAASVGLLHDYWGMVFVMAVGLAWSVVALVDAVRVATRRQSYQLKPFNRWFVYGGVVILVVLISIPVRSVGGIRAFKIPSEAMLPSLEVGDFIMARLETSESYENRRGDILVFLYPGDNRTMYVKRVVAFPDEEFEIRDGSLLVNGQAVEAAWARRVEAPVYGAISDFGPVTVPDGTLFVLGDNLPNSADSRTWGPLPQENIVGVAEFIYFSWDGHKNRVRFDRIGTDIDASK
jgi:signal peptidase I